MMAERLPETCRVIIPMKLEFIASVGFIHKESVTMRGHTIVNFTSLNYCSSQGCVAYVRFSPLLFILNLSKLF